MSISIIAAIGEKNELGKNGDLIWKAPGDLAFFKEKTMNQTIIMGRKTFDSLPRRLEGRNYVVLSNHATAFPDYVKIVRGIPELIKKYSTSEDAFVIGGSQIYQQLLPYVNEMYLTEIAKTYEPTNDDQLVFFPNFTTSDWEQHVIDSYSDNNISYRHVYYKRNK